MDNEDDPIGQAAVALWDAEAAAFDDPPDHGLRDPAVRAAWRDLLLSLLPPAPARVADLGCGTGSLALLLAEEGYAVDGVDLSPQMILRAEAKAGHVATFTRGDAWQVPLEAEHYDVVLCRHVLWALPDATEAVRRWDRLLRPGGTMVLVEGSWSTGAGLTGAQTLDAVTAAGRRGELLPLPDPALWGRAIDDERYAVTSSSRVASAG
ncbi:MAG: methyltransferase domain-containing protein [Actinobacteria bacterium]|uniref:Unannotated protein n=1 Tax=freshwater metagenome TaxID=449393 RepID=A0A6J6NXC0_9ZZZZ|nr:methyltransferase domain-containing protein [Actinomycetota bacterium]